MNEHILASTEDGPRADDLNDAALGAHPAETDGNLHQSLLANQNLSGALMAGAAAMVISALVWAAVTVATEYQIGWMAVGVGFAVGIAVRRYGQGVEPIFGFIGATFALLGCLLGNLLSMVGFIANAESVDYLNVLLALDINMIVTIFTETFSGMDIVFYAIAIYEGYRFSLPSADG